MAKTNIYAILDKVAGMIIGGLHMYKHDAAAIRFFQDVAEQQNSGIGRHPADYSLIKLAELDIDESKILLPAEDIRGLTWDSEHTTVLPTRVVLDGAAWAAMQAQANANKEA